MNLLAWPQAKIEFLNAQGFSPTTLFRFWKYVRFTSSCWLWEGPPHRRYGRLQVGGNGIEQTIRAHKLSWIIHHGIIPDGLHVLHKCDIGRCVNPDHLWLGTQLQNNQDMAEKGRAAKGEQCGNSKLTELEVLRIREVSGLGHSQKEIAAKFKISPSQVSALHLRKFWKHI